MQLTFIELAFVIVLFAGLAFMFLAILRGQERLLKSLHEDNLALREDIDELAKIVLQGQEYQQIDEREEDENPEEPTELLDQQSDEEEEMLSLDHHRKKYSQDQSRDPDRLDMDTSNRRGRNSESGGMPDLKL